MTQEIRRVDKDLRFEVRRLAAPEDRVSMACQSITQRVWSRTGTAEQVDGVGQGTTYFVKQYIDRTGAAQEEHWSNERAGSGTAARVFSETIRVPQIQFSSRTSLIHIFEHCPAWSMDELLRADAEAFDAAIHQALAALPGLLNDLLAAAKSGLVDDIPVRARSYGSANAVNFTGFEIRNMGVAARDGIADNSQLLVFDCGRPYLAPIEEVAARVLLSVGLLNWGRPLQRFARGPDEQLFHDAVQVLDQHLDPVAVASEFDREQRLRTGRVMGLNFFEESLKKIGIGTLGVRYLRKLRELCTRYVR